jgi:parallel beta-helix repeat protein
LNANSDDSILFDIATTDPGYHAPTGVVTINLTSNALTINKSLTISELGSHVVVRRNVATPFSIISIFASVTVSIDSLTIANGAADFGGAIFNDNGTVFLSNCTLTGNQALDIGGGVALFNDSNATVRNCKPAFPLQTTPNRALSKH